MERGNVDSSAELPPAKYPGEDTRPTSRKELLGFYTYSFAAEVFPICGLGAFIPIALETLARQSASAVLASDHSRPCAQPGTERSFSNVTARRNQTPHGVQCDFRFFGTYINTASFAMYTFSVSVLLQALLVITMSAAADHGRYRKTLLVGFAIAGAIATMLFLLVSPAVYWLGSVWAIVGNVCFGGSFVLLNSFLPLLVRNHPAAKDPNTYTYHSEESADGQEAHLHDVVDSTAALLPSDEQTAPYPPSASLPSPQMQLSTRISSYGVGIGYIAAVIVQILALVIIQLTGASLYSIKLVLFVIGLWWLCFTFPAMLWLRPRPGPPLSSGQKGKSRTWLAYMWYSWASLARTLVRARKLRDVLLFQAGWFMISDAIATVSGTAILFAKTTLGMGSSALALINVVVFLSGIVGAFSWSAVSRTMHLKPGQTILFCIYIFELIPLYGLLGYIPAIQRLGVFGLQQQWEMYPLGAVFGLVLGGLSSYCRSLFGELIPAGSEAAFYALYAITDKGSSVFGPAVVGAITDATGDIRPAFWFLAALIGLPIPLIYLVDLERGKRDAAALGT
ncbi:hypothetical protein BAUCODRAFT_64064 [Baudoinia panamericana UAMH 10762]|uniref:Autophagy-related protein n=1 Tax=Baudoinia panamericana (strain UAMH 10762) TaxID=717646 RepID=M2N795_BAUPA|nr:uncharacterized protein BAUCODRAFT_64064 [Baudoinia panamericana UAMH 10762]EMC99963.1 hypothetical protein BAUCODRAFT_64064 [Baudoinia panamericana UAMH 10762]